MKRDPAMLQAALEGYQGRLTEIEEAIAEVQRRLGKRAGTRKTPLQPVKRVVSAASRRRMAAGQKRRWARVRRAKGKQ